MDINSCYPGSYLKAADLGGKTVMVRIEDVRLEDIGGEDKPVVYFTDHERGLVLNKTNAGLIQAFLGTSETDEMCGKHIKLVVEKVSFQGRIVDAIRVKAARPKPVEAETDDIPF